MSKINATLFYKRIRKHTTPLLVAGFVAILLLYVLIIAIGLSNMFSAQSRINNIVESDNVKATLLNQMHTSARERSLLLHTMLDTEDPFIRDEYYLQFNFHGGQFARARIKLLAMPLNEYERKLLDKQGKLSGVAVPIQNQIIDLIHADEFEKANLILNNEAVPRQNKVLDHLLELQRYQSEIAVSKAKQSNNDIESALFQTAVLGMIAIIVSIFIANFVTHGIRKTEKDLKIEKQLAETTLHSIGDAVITTDINDYIVSINPVAELLTGWSQNEAKSHKIDSLFKLFEEDSREPIINPLRIAMRENRIVHSANNIQLGSSAGKIYAIEYTASPIVDEMNKVHGGVLTFRDVTEFRSLAAQLSYQASHDTLTGLVNRNEFELRLQQALTNARAEHHQYALCYMDLDQFKVINDTCGHAAGDELLKQLSAKLKAKLRDSDTLARLGGDEFGILFDGCSLDKAREIAAKLLDTVRELRFAWDNKTFEIGVSIGLVPISSLSGNTANILSAADTACYEAKDQGRNRIHVYDTNDINLLRRRGEMDWVHRINDALDKEHIILYAQPIVDLENDKTKNSIFGFEILVRLKGEDGNIILPNAFIPAAERYNLMPQVDKYIITKAINKLETLQNKNYKFFINISGQSICDKEFVSSLLNLLDSSSLNPEILTFEITETAAVTNFSVATQFISALKQRGCLFALDDFGSGLSSFTYLKNIPVDFLKIDGSFIRDITIDKTDYAFVEAINQIGSLMGLKTIAEYVEVENILQKLKGIGVHYAQGYHLDTPAPLEDIEQLNFQSSDKISA